MKNILPALFLSLVCPAWGQQVLENNPPSVKWLQLKTPNFRILYSADFEDQAQRVANSLEHIREAEARSLGGSLPRRISVILQNQSAVSNGFVSLLPRRSEFYAMPSQDYNFTGTNDWLNMLVAHEYRHIVQFQHAKRGFNRALYYLFGATTLAGMSQAAAPDWFWEGDAVVTETAFTRSGRGSIPHFSLAFRTNLLEGRAFNYHKQHLRSFKHHIPNEYVLGFHMVSYLRKRTNDPDIWGKITARSWNLPFIPFAFSNAIKKETGLYVRDLYREMVGDFQERWTAHLSTLTLTPFETVNIRENEAYTDYLYPQPMDNGDVLALRVGIGDIEQFVRLRDGKVRKVFTPGFINDAGMLSMSGTRVVWNEFGFDPRWAVRNYSLVKSIDIDDPHVRVVGSKRARYGGAAISPDGEQVVTVRTTTDYQTNLVLLDVHTGVELKVFGNPENNFFSMPRWSPDGTGIVVLRTSPEGRTISVVDVASGGVKDLFPATNENKGHPVLAGDYVFYNSGITGIDNIFALDIQADRTFQVTSSRYGAYNPAVSPDGKYIYYNEQTRNGMDVVRIPFQPASWTPFSPPAEHVESFTHLVEQESTPNIFASVPEKQYPSTKYSKLKGLINPYTWGLTVETNLTEASLGIASRDILSTTSVTLGYVFDVSERTGALEARVSYQGLFPIIDLSASVANRNADIGMVGFDRIVGDDTIAVSQNVLFDWDEKKVTGGVRVPLIATSGKYASNVTVGNEVGLTSVTNFSNNVDGGGRIFPDELPRRIVRDYIDNGSLIHNHFSLEVSRLLKRSRRDINSRWGQRLFVDAFSTPYGGDFYGSQFSAYAVAYFPGLFKHHSLWGYGAYQHTRIDPANLTTGEGMNQYTFRNQVPLPRGHSISRAERYYSFAVNYTLPVWYPDIALGPVLNLQRLRATVFYDHAHGRNGSGTSMWNSAGAEVKLDLNVMRFFPRFDIGFRFSYGITPAVKSYELLIGSFNF